MRTVVLLSLIGLIIIPCIHADDEATTLDPAATAAAAETATSEVHSPGVTAAVQEFTTQDSASQADTTAGQHADGSVSTDQGTGAEGVVTTGARSEAAGTQGGPATDADGNALGGNDGVTTGQASQSEIGEVTTSGSVGRSEETTSKSVRDTGSAVETVTSGGAPGGTPPASDRIGVLKINMQSGQINQTTRDLWRSKLRERLRRYGRGTTATATVQYTTNPGTTGIEFTDPPAQNQNHRRRRREATTTCDDPKIVDQIDENGNLFFAVSCPGWTASQMAEYLANNRLEIAEEFGISADLLSADTVSKASLVTDVARTTVGIVSEVASDVATDKDTTTGSPSPGKTSETEVSLTTDQTQTTVMGTGQILNITLKECNISTPETDLWKARDKLKCILKWSAGCDPKEMSKIICRGRTQPSGSERRRRDTIGNSQISPVNGDNGDLMFGFSNPSVDTTKALHDYIKEYVPLISKEFNIPENQITMNPHWPSQGADSDTRVKPNREGVWEAHKGLLLTVIILIAAALLIALVCFGIMKCRRQPSQDKQLLAMEQGKRDPVAASNPIPDDVIIRDEAPNLMQERENPAVTPNGGGQHISKEDEDNGWVVPLDQLSQNEKAKPEVENTKL